MEDVRISTLSTEYVLVPVQGRAAGANVDLSSLTVRMAFMDRGQRPSSGDWKAASWETGDFSGWYNARCLVGPTGVITLTPGSYDVWIEITDAPEKPIRKVGVLVCE